MIAPIAPVEGLEGWAAADRFVVTVELAGDQLRFVGPGHRVPPVVRDDRLAVIADLELQAEAAAGEGRDRTAAMLAERAELLRFELGHTAEEHRAELERLGMSQRDAIHAVWRDHRKCTNRQEGRGPA